MLSLRDALSDLRSWPPTDDTRKPYRAGGGMLHLTDIAHAGATARQRTFIVGLDAERAGGGARQDPLIPDVARRAFGDGRLPDVNARRAGWTESLGVALSSLRGRVTVSYAIRGGTEGRDCGPSPLLLQVHRMNAGDGKLTFEQLRAALAPPACAVPHTGANASGAALDARDVWLQAIAGDALLLDADAAVREAFPMLAGGLDAHALHDGDVLSACHGLVPEAGPALDPTRPGAPYLSPSALEQIGKCPLQWFYRKGLGIHAERDPEFDADAWLDALERGSLLHKVFETFVLAYKDRQRDVLLPEAESVLREMTSSVIDQWRVHEPPPSESVCATESAELHRAARAFLQMEREAIMRGEAATWEATEFPFGVTAPALYATSDGRRIVLRGVADRIDLMGDGTLRIVDYKTGNPKKYRPGTKRGPYDGGRLLQPALYADAISAERGTAVSVFEYRFPTDKGGNAIVGYTVESLGAAREVITALVDHVSQGRFLPTTDATDCKHCDYAPICRVSGSDFTTDSPRAEWAARVAATMPEYQSMLARRGKASGGEGE
jgi:ATP-dependent helicase/nuclease subunit B